MSEISESLERILSTINTLAKLLFELREEDSKKIEKNRKDIKTLSHQVARLESVIIKKLNKE